MSNTSRMHTYWRRWGANLLLLLSSILVGLLLVEGLLRVLGLTSREIVLSRGMQIDEDCGFVLRPGAQLNAIPGVMPVVRINSLGLRDQEYSEKKPPQTVRILALGDSFTYGRVHYEYNFLTLLEERLDQHWPEWRVEILNAGVPAYQPVNELHYLKKYGFRLEPDLVLLNFYVGNDLFSNEKEPTDLHPEAPIHDELETVETLPLYSLLRWSELYWTVLNFYARYQVLEEINQRVPELDPSQMEDPRRIHPDFWMMDEEQYGEELKQQMRLYFSSERRNDWDRENFVTTVAVIQEMAEMCRERGVDFAVVLIPSEVQVDEKVRELFQEAIEEEIPVSTFDFEQPQKTLVQQLNETGIHCLDLLPAFSRQGKEKRLYLLRDTHWNEEGNALAAEKLFSPIGGWIEEWIKQQEANEVKNMGNGEKP